jgi:hypothetical protein
LPKPVDPEGDGEKLRLASITEALIDHHRVIEKIRADIPAGELTLQDMDSFNDQPIVRRVGDTAADAVKTMWPLQWRAARSV